MSTGEPRVAKVKTPDDIISARLRCQRAVKYFHPASRPPSARGTMPVITLPPRVSASPQNTPAAAPGAESRVRLENNCASGG